MLGVLHQSLWVCLSRGRRRNKEGRTEKKKDFSPQRAAYMCMDARERVRASICVHARRSSARGSLTPLFGSCLSRSLVCFFVRLVFLFVVSVSAGPPRVVIFG